MDLELPSGAPSSVDLAFVEDLYYEWLRDPTAVGAAWSAWFASLDPATSSPAAPGGVARVGSAPGAAGHACLIPSRVQSFAAAHR
jgi:2-oxoglutarate dehydrogenase complex dehydrogenase (E1) component-like enzyme